MEEGMIEDRSLPPLRVLFVDDERNILASLSRLMAAEGIETVTADSGAGGLAVLEADREIGVIVSDQRMPEMNGAQFLEKARELAPDAQRFILTGYSDLDSTIDAINKGGAHRFITKPWNDDELIRVIREALKTSGLERENQRLTELVRRKNEELKEWNGRLKTRVLEQTASIREKNEDLRRQHEKLRSMFNSTLTAFSGLMELRSPKLRNHLRNVSDLTTAIAGYLDIPPEQVEQIRIAAILHDIGKIGIPDEFLNQDPGDLNREELEIYMQHPVRGQAAIDPVDILRPAGLLVRNHHENFDGSGFPDGLTGGEIPLGSRIIALADFTDREMHRDGPAVQEIMNRVRKWAGIRFDPDLVPLLEKPLRLLHATLFKQGNGVRKRLPPDQVCEGMTLLENLYSGTGVLLLSKGAVLDAKAIAAIRRYQEIDPCPGEISVLTRG